MGWGGPALFGWVQPRALMLCSTEVSKRPPAGKWPESDGQRRAVSRRWGKRRSREQFESCFLDVGILEIERNVVTRESHGEEWTQDLESAKPKAWACGPAPLCQLDNSGKVTQPTEALFPHLHWDHFYSTGSTKITSVCKKGCANTKLQSFCKKKKKKPTARIPQALLTPVPAWHWLGRSGLTGWHSKSAAELRCQLTRGPTPTSSAESAEIQLHSAIWMAKAFPGSPFQHRVFTVVPVGSPNIPRKVGEM